MFSGLKNFIITFCVSVLIFGLIAYFVIQAVSASITAQQDEPDSTGTGEVTVIPSDTTNGNSATDPTTPQIKGDSFTLLLVGTDYQSKFEDYDSEVVNRGNTGFPIAPRVITADSILLVRVDKASSAYVFSSIPSNTKVILDGANTTLGTLYSERGLEFLRRKVTALTGLEIDYYAAISLDGFAKVIDRIGGVTFTVPTDMLYSDPKENPDAPIIDIKSGTRTLSGEQASAMLRYVTYVDGNRSRMDLSVSFAKAVLRELTQAANLAKLDYIFTDVVKQMETNVTINTLTECSELLAAYPTFKSEVINYPGVSVTVGGEEMYEPNIQSAMALYQKYR